MRSRFCLVLLPLLALASCSDDPARPKDSGAARDEGWQPLDGFALPDSPPGTPCSKVQTCAESCNEPGYAACIAACKEPASAKAKALLAAYEECAAKAVAGACKTECAGGVGSELCGQCVLPQCIAQWNDCRLDE